MVCCSLIFWEGVVIVGERPRSCAQEKRLQKVGRFFLRFVDKKIVLFFFINSQKKHQLCCAAINLRCFNKQPAGQAEQMRAIN